MNSDSDSPDRGRPLESTLEEWLAQRRAHGQDLFDEVCEEEYHVVPAPHPSHGMVDQQLAELLGPLARAVGLIGSGPLNLGVPDDYRVPDRVWLRTSAVLALTASELAERLDWPSTA